jgi:hypothetical protein
MHNDLPTWNLILSLSALILTLPLAILGTILAPKVEDWWAWRSKRSLTDRIEKLEKKLRELDEKTPLTEIEEKILEVLQQAIFIFGYLLAGVVILIYRSTNSPHLIVPGFGLDLTQAIIIAVCMGLLVAAFGLPIRNLRKERTTKYREALRTQIEELKERSFV